MSPSWCELNRTSFFVTQSLLSWSRKNNDFPVVFAWFCTIGVLLTTTGVKEYTIVDQNNCTKSSYKVGDPCEPENFEKSSQCPSMMCTFTFQKNIFGDWRNWFNLFAFLWTMEFVTALGEFVLARTYSKW